jgi:hypothetical protein
VRFDADEHVTSIASHLSHTTGSVGHSALAVHPEAEVVPTPHLLGGAFLATTFTVVSNVSMASRGDRVKMRRPWTTATAVLTAAHHGFELSSGVGLVLQPELGLGFAGALWGTGIPAWIRIAAKDGDAGWDPLLAAWSGASLAGVIVHFSLWPWRYNKLGIPVLTEAEALPSSSLPAYNVLLYVWAAASALSIIREVRPGARRWALVGLVTMPLLRRSAQHHFSWLKQEALTNPAWWNRGAA